MSDILFIKTSSLGDVIHHMPAVSEARRGGRTRASPGWWRRRSRRWCGCIRRSTTSFRSRRGAGAGCACCAVDLAEIRAFRRRLRAHEYAEVIDTQGLFRSALIARRARGRRHGYDRAEHPGAAGVVVLRRAPSCRAEPARDRAQPRADRAGARLCAGGRARLRARSRRASLSGEAGGALRRAAARTARPEKEWPVANWTRSPRRSAADFELVLPWGTKPSDAGAAHRVGHRDGRACRTASRSMRWRG